MDHRDAGDAADRANAPARVALVAAVVGFSVYFAGFVASWWLPEPPAGGVEDEVAVR